MYEALIHFIMSEVHLMYFHLKIHENKIFNIGKIIVSNTFQIYLFNS